MKRLSLDFWSRVRTVNWILGGIGVVWMGFHAVFHPLARRYYPEPILNYLAFTDDGRTLVGSGVFFRDSLIHGEVKAWDVATGRRLWAEADHVNNGNAPSSLMPGGSLIVTACPTRFGGPGGLGSRVTIPYRYGLLLVFRDARTGRTTNSTRILWRETPYRPASIDVSPDGRSVAVAVADGVIVWNAATRDSVFRRVRTLSRPADAGKASITKAQFTADGQHLVVLSSEYGTSSRRSARADLWSAHTGERIHTFGVSGKTSTFALSPDRRRVAAFEHKGKYGYFALWDVASRKRVTKANVGGLYLSPGDLKFLDSQERRVGYGTELVMLPMSDPLDSGGPYSISTALYWDPKLNTIQSVTSPNPWGVEHMKVLSPDGRLAATHGPWDRGLAVLRDARTGREVRQMDDEGGR